MTGESFQLLGVQAEYRPRPLTREATSFIANRFPRIEHPQARITGSFDDDTLRLDLTESIMHDAAETSRKAIEHLTDTTLALWLIRQGWTVEPPNGQPLNYTRSRGKHAADATPREETRPS